MHINNFPGDLTDTSAKTKSLDAYHEHGLPARLDVLDAREHHKRETANDEFTDLRCAALAHHDHKRLQEVILERVVCQLTAFQELHADLQQ